MSVDDVIGGRYRLVRRLGRGATGEVYEARDGDRAVALKLLYPHYAGDPTNRGRLDRELEVVRDLVHPNIVRPLDMGWDERRETLFLVMELLEGETLAERLRNEPAPTRGALVAHVFEALEGLAAAHAAGVVHRDIKPENVFIDRGATPPRARLIDFGLAKHVAGDHLTLTEFALGTPTYMAPEQATRARDAGFTADVWSVGVLLYRIAAGFAPFEGDGPYDVLLKSTTQPAPPLVGVPASMARLIGTCLEKEAELRPSSAAELKANLRQVVADPAVRSWLDAPSAAPRGDRDATLPAIAPPRGVAALQVGAEPTSGSGRRRRYGVFVAALGLGVAGVAAGGLLREATGPDRAGLDRIELAPPPPTFESRPRVERLRPERVTPTEDEDPTPGPTTPRRPRRPAAAAVTKDEVTPAPSPPPRAETRSDPALESPAPAAPEVQPAPAAPPPAAEAPPREPSVEVAAPPPGPDATPPPKEADEGTTEKKIRPEELLTF